MAVVNPFVAYTTVAALQLRVVWNIWRYADLTGNDTSYYFVDAASWAHGLHENFVYYPLYDAFWGSILMAVRDVYAATILQRVVIILAATLLVLALMRSLLGSALGLLVGAWWAVVPANYDALYEVHLFGALPIALAVLVVARTPRREGIGIAVAILLASAVLIRTELIAATVILAAVIVAYEVRALRMGHRARKSAYLRAYIVPLAFACLLIGGAYARSHVQGYEAWAQLKAKEQANFCATYAASYQQRHPARFVGNPFTECAPLMQQTFGRPMPTILRAAGANPRGVAGFVAWNAQLLPGGLQVALFDATAFENDPGFGPVDERSTYALVLSVVLLIGMSACLCVAIRERKLSLRRAPPQTRWVVVTLASISVATVLVILTTRPWSEYMYGLTICALVVIGTSVSVLLRRSGGTGFLAPVTLATALVLIVVLPSAFSGGSRPIYDAVQHLQVVQQRLQQPGSVLITDENANAVCNYLAYSYERVCTPVYWSALRSRVTRRTTVGQVFDRVHATAIYVTGRMLAEPMIAGLMAAPRAQGWQQIAHGTGAAGRWCVLIPLSQRS